MFNIHSVYSDRELIFRAQTKQRFEVELGGNGFSAVIGVWLDTYRDSLSVFFQKLASFKQPWRDAYTWESLEGEFSLSVTCTTLGQVTFLVKLRHVRREPEDWQLEASLVTELGQLDKIAKDANTFFHQIST